MKKVVIESPFAGSTKLNIAYAKMAVHDSLSRGEAPIASHLLLAAHGICNDDEPYERSMGIDAGLAWHSVADDIAFYTDLGMSPGMEAAQKHALENGYAGKIVFRAMRNKHCDVAAAIAGYLNKEIADVSAIDLKDFFTGLGTSGMKGME